MLAPSVSLGDVIRTMSRSILVVRDSEGSVKAILDRDADEL
jgi:hypothetical protein